MPSLTRERQNTEVAETLCDLCVKALQAQRTRRVSFWLRPPGRIVYIAAEPGSVGAPLVGALKFRARIPTGKGRHEASPYVHLVIELRKV